MKNLDGYLSYHPQDVSRAASLLLGGAVLDKCLQPHESHVPFLLQFLVDCNLYGMGHLHASKMKFRHPVPEAFCSRKAKYNRPYEQTDAISGVSADSQIQVVVHVLVHQSGYLPQSQMVGFGNSPVKIRTYLLLNGKVYVNLRETPL